ncbi:MAG: pyrroloquinoline quinone biosynthesis protein PqqB [Acidobacteria bacterium]|nr:pyrroloquinoline quinone biosynthesis protein PqqB [Acidobacteriota bacterium]
MPYRPTRRRAAAWAAAVVGVAACLAALAALAAVGAPPRVVVVALGTAQDGGVPQAGCDCVRCAAARRDPARRRRVASLALCLPASGLAWLIDATPDLGDQLELVHRLRPHPAGAPDRHPVDGVLLTHAHAGHFLGLAFFGFEAIDSRDLPVFASPRMAAFLRGNGPWNLLVARRNILLREMAPGAAQALAPGLTVTPLPVPHRDELSDTMGFLVRGPRRTLLYVPDTDSWAAWAQPLPEVLRRERVDVALLDGTFYAAGELPDRDVRRIGHPLMTATVALLREQVRGGLQVFFTHLNHSNPALDPEGPERRALAAAGFHVLEEGQQLDL